MLSAHTLKLLQEELSELRDVRLPNCRELVESAAAAGDMSQNPDFFIAAEEERQVRERIAQIERALADADNQQPDSDVKPGHLRPGCVVTLSFDGENEQMLFGSIEEAKFSSLPVVTESSPLGKALSQAKVGDSISWSVASGALVHAVVVASDLP